MAYESASQGGYGAGPSVIPTDAAQPDVVSISDAELLFTGHFERKGPDLVLTGHDGRHHLIPGYFSAEHPAALVAPNGARITGDLVELLAGSQAPGHYAQTAAPAPTNAIGRIEKVVGDVTVMRNGVAVALHVGDAVYKSDVVQTGADSSCGIGFPDGTALNLVANTRMALNDYVYDPNGSSNDALFSLVQGGFAFVAGKVAHTGDMKITTPVATMGIRGTTGYALEQVATVNANLGNVTMSFAVVADPGTDRVGQYDLIDQFGNVVAVVGQAGIWTNVSWLSANSPPTVTQQQMTAANFTLEQQLVPALVEILNSLGNLTPTPQSGPNNPGSSTPPNFELINFQQLLQQNSGTPFTISVPVNGPNGPTTTPGTVTISANPETGVSSSTVVNWVAQSNGNWETPANWSGNGVPTAPETVDITLPIKVTIKSAESASGLFIGAGAILNIVSGGALELSNGISNFGTFQLNSSGADPTLAINGTVYLLDGGEIALKGPTAENLIVGVPGTGATLVNVDNIIIGSGTIGQGDGVLTLINGANGTIEAKPFGGDSGLLVIDTGNDATNSGVFTAAAGGTLQIEDHVTNFGLIQALGGGTILLADRITNSGTIGASGPGAMVGLEAAFISGGTLETDTGGVIETLAGASTFLNVSLADGSVIDAGANTVLRLHGSTVLDGTVTFKGQGTFTLGGAGAEVVGQGHTVELDNFGTITGAGNIGGDDQHFMLVNEQSGTIDANGQLTLTIDNDSPGSADTQPSNAVINTGTIEATGIGGLAIVNTTISNASDAAHNTGIVEVASGSQIALDDATILHGSVTIASGGEMQTASGTANTINTAEGQDNLSTPTLINAGTLLVNDGSSLTLVSPDAIDNSGTIQLNSTGDATYLYFDQADAGINGGGNIILSDSIANIVAVTQSGDHLTNFDNTISGAGTIGAGGMVLVNDGVINADQQSAALTLDPAFLTNAGTLEATNNATLVLSNTTVSNSSATTQAGGSYSFNNTIDDQLAGGPTAPTGIFGINDAGQVVGNYISSGSHGFLDDITLDGTSANAINDSGEIVGTYSAGGKQSGFLFSNGTYVTLNDPLGADGTIANGINNAGQIVGEYNNAHGTHGFVFSNGAYTTLDDPLGINGTDAKGINDAGQIVGYYLDGSSVAHGFIYNNGTYTTLNDPSAANGTFAEGINDAGQVVGYYYDASDVAHGFVYSNGTYFNFDDSSAGTGAGEGTFAFAINNAGRVSGYYSAGNGGVGFLATPAQSLTSGSIFADSGAAVDLVGSSIVGGNLTTAAAANGNAAGLIDVTGGATSAIYDATISKSGAFSIEQGSQLNVSGTTLAGGSLTVAGVLDSIGTSFITDAAITNTGKIDATAGTLTINDPVSFSNTGTIEATNGATLAIDPTTATNNGTIEASGDHSVVAISISGMLDNGGTLLASGKGTMSIDVSGITNETGGLVKADSGSLTIDELGNGSANYGTYEAIDGGILTINHAGSATNYGTFKADGGTFVLNNNAGDTNHGTLAAADGGTLDVNLVSDSGSGGGNYATVEAISGGTVAIAGGFANLGGATIEATGDNSRVDFTNENVSNAGTMQALDHGTLSFTSAAIDNAGGTIAASGDFCVVELSDATIAGGTLATGSLTSDSSGKIEIAAAGGVDTSVFDGSASPLTIDGYVRVDAGAKLELIGTIDNRGTIDVSSGDPNLVIDGEVCLEGSGNIVLSGAGDNIVGATCNDSCNVLINYNDISGAGAIGNGDGHLALTNECGGTVDANVSGETLTMHTGNSISNAGTLEATNGGILQIYDEVCNSCGTVEANSGGAVDIVGSISGGSATIAGGTLEYTGYSNVNTTFNGSGTLVLAGTSHFTGTLFDVGSRDVIDLTGIQYSASGTTLSYDTDTDVLTVTDQGGPSISIQLSGTYAQNDFTLQQDSGTGTEVVVSSAAIDSFSGGTINTDYSPGPKISPDGSTLTLTYASNSANDAGDHGSWFSSGTYPINSFTTSFDYQASGSADGMAFILQDSTAGSSALGTSGGGGGLGYDGIFPSAAVEFNIYDGHMRGTYFATNGSTGNYNPTGDVEVQSGHEIQVVLSYNDSVLTETLTDLTNGHTYSTSYNNVDLASILGSDTAYVGFSGGTGADTSTQTVSNFTFQVDPTVYWAGASGADWTTANAWTVSGGNTIAPPNYNNDVVIGESGSYTLTITSADTTNSLTITSAGASADVQDETGGSLALNGALTIEAGSFSLVGGSLTTASICIGSSGHFIAEGTVSAPIDNDGGIVEAYGNLMLSAAVTGAGTFQIDNGNTLELGSSVAAGTTVSFGGSTGALQLDAAAGADLNISGFTGTTPDPAHSDEIELAGAWTTTSSLAGTGGNLVVNLTDGSETATLTFDNFSETLDISNNGADTFIFDPPAKSSGASVSADNDTFVFHPGIGAETATNFNPKADSIELDHFANIESVQQLASLITTDAEGDAVIALGHHDSITLPGVSANYLQAHLHSLVHLN